jgi:hypothetical protein
MSAPGPVPGGLGHPQESRGCPSQELETIARSSSRQGGLPGPLRTSVRQGSPGMPGGSVSSPIPVAWSRCVRAWASGAGLSCGGRPGDACLGLHQSVRRAVRCSEDRQGCRRAWQQMLWARQRDPQGPLAPANHPPQTRGAGLRGATGGPCGRTHGHGLPEPAQRGASRRAAAMLQGLVFCARHSALWSTAKAHGRTTPGCASGLTPPGTRAP